MSPRYWIGVIHKQMAEAARQGGFCAFSHGKESAVAKLSVGDHFVLYAPRETLDGAPVQAFVALGQVADGPIAEKPFMGGQYKGFMRPATYLDVTEVPVRPMLGDLGFVTNPTHWGMAFRRSLFQITPEDFTTISNAMGVK